MEQFSILKLTYYVLWALAILGGFAVVFGRNTVHCALALVGTMLCLAGIFLLIHAPFVALIQVFVYAGAIMVLFLYVVMLLNPRRAESIAVSAIMRRAVAVILIPIFSLIVTLWMLPVYVTMLGRAKVQAAGLKEIVSKMLQQYLLPFELTSVLLLIAILGAVIIARRDRTE